MAFQNLGNIPPLPQDKDAALKMLYEIVLQQQSALDEINKSFFTVTHVAPTKAIEGEIKFADGTNWNPGAGRGLYQRVGVSWIKL